MRTKLRTQGVILAAVLSMMPTVGLSATSSLNADVEVLYPVPPAGRNGGVSAMNGGTMQRLDDAAGGPMLRLSSAKGPTTGVWWFPNHLPMKPQQAMVGDPSAHIALDVQAASPTETEITVTWRANTDGTAVPGETVKAGPFKIASDKPTHVELPIPRPADGQKMSGLIFGFVKPGDYQIRRLAITRQSATLIDPIAAVDPHKAGDVTITGRAAAGIENVTLRFTPQSTEVPAIAPVQKQLPVQNGKFSFTTNEKDIPAGLVYSVTAEPSGAKEQASPAQRLFLFPALTGEKASPVTRDGSNLIADGKPMGFMGFNYTRFNLGLGNEANYEFVAHDLMQMQRWGVRVVRTPIDLAMVEPEPGVFPDNPRYAEVLKAHNLDPRYWDQIEYFIAVAGQHDIYTVLDWHNMPIDPYSYFHGGRPSKRDSGEPGTAIAYLAPDKLKFVEFDLTKPDHLKTLLDADRWIAGRIKGNPNVLAMEIPYNEPHTTEMAVEATWRKMVDLCAKTIGEVDPNRMTFVQAPSYAHNNLLASTTWLLPDRATGNSPHFYQANGPVPLRPDAKKHKSPWLARDLTATFGWGFQTVMLPSSAVEYPVYNGESGMYGHQTLLDQKSDVDGAMLLMESQLVQVYATGLAGHLEWTLWGNETDFDPYLNVYSTLFRRFGPVFRAGPVNRNSAQVLFIQNNEASPSGNGHNYACAPFAKAALDLHLGIVHYMTDAQFLYNTSAELSLGLEQVASAAGKVPYKAIVVDRRLLNPKVETILKSVKVPVLFVDKADDLTVEKFTQLLTDAQVAFDNKTPKEIELIEGPEHLVVYRRLDGAANPAKIFPQLKHAGPFTLVDESGKTVFEGDAAALASTGIDVDLPLWNTAIFKINAK